MRVAMVLPGKVLLGGVVERWIRLVQDRFPGSALTLLAPASFLDSYQGQISIHVVAAYEDAAVRTHDVVIFLRGEPNSSPSADIAADCLGRAYTMDINGRMLAVNRKMDAFEFPAINSHVFNRLESREPEGGFYYFPYGYLFRYTGFGPINPFGFRITQDIEELCRRGPDHKVVAIFGGSAVWSMYCATDEAFHAHLERRLNEAAGGHVRFTVLNFGMHGHVVMNEMLAYLLYCHRVRPDYVIAHDGWNDFFYGMLSDEFLLNAHDLTYQYNLENWSQLLHASYEQPTSQPAQPFQPKALAQNVMKAYVRRKLQFQRIVEAFGGVFVWGLQPSLFSKASLSLSEQKAARLEPGSAYSLAYPRVRHLFDNFDDLVDLPKGSQVLNLHREFRRFGEDLSLFIDHVHTSPAGDEKIAEFYAEYFLRQLYTKPGSGQILSSGRQ